MAMGGTAPLQPQSLSMTIRTGVGGTGMEATVTGAMGEDITMPYWVLVLVSWVVHCWVPSFSNLERTLT